MRSQPNRSSMACPGGALPCNAFLRAAARAAAARWGSCQRRGRGASASAGNGEAPRALSGLCSRCAALKYRLYFLYSIAIV
jgi:hypothetical protein